MELRRDRAVGCFHALLSVLQRALAAFIREIGDRASEELRAHCNQAANGTVAEQYKFLCGHCDGHFEAVFGHDVERDLKLVVEIQTQFFCSVSTTEVAFVRGIVAIDRVLVAIKADDTKMEHVEILKRVLDVDVGDQSDDSNEDSQREGEDDDHRGGIVFGSITVQVPVVEARPTSEDFSAQIQAGVAAFDAKRFAEAATYFSHALAQLPTDGLIDKRVKVYGHRTRCRLAMNDAALALDDAEAGLALKASWLDGHRLKCTALMQLERWHEASRECDIVLEGAPRDVVFLQHKQTLAKKITGPTSSAPVPSPPSRSVTIADSEDLCVAKTMIASGNFMIAITRINKELARAQLDETYTKKRLASVIALRARCRVGLGAYALAEASGKEALALDVDCVDAYLWLAANRFKLKVYAKAFTACGQGLSLSPHHEELLKIREKLHSKSHTRNASAVLNNLQSRGREAHKYVLSKQLGKAVVIYKALLAELHSSHRSTDEPSIASKLVKLYGHVARCLLSLEQCESAVVYATAGLTVEFSWLEGHRLKCTALLELERWNEALTECEVVLAAAPHDTSFQQIRATIQKRLTPSVADAQLSQPTDRNSPSSTAGPLPPTGNAPSKVDILTLQGRGYELLTTNRSADADAIMSRAIALSLQWKSTLNLTGREQALLYFIRARCRVQLEQFATALEDVRVGSAADPAWIEANRIACLALIGLERWQEALVECDRVLNREPTDPVYIAHRHSIALKIEATKLVPPFPPVASAGSGDNLSWEQSRCKALRYLEAGDREAAVRWFTQAIDACPITVARKNRARIFVHRGRCRLELKEHGPALEDAVAALKLNASSVDGHRLQCEALAALGRWKEAHDACNQALTVFPTDGLLKELRQTVLKRLQQPALPPVPPSRPTVKTLIQSATQAMEKGSHAEADALFTKALSVATASEPNEVVRVLGHRTRLRLETKQFALAAIDAQAGVKRDPSWVDGYRLLCSALMQMEQWEDALVAISRVVQLVPTDNTSKLRQEELRRRLQPSKQASISDTTHADWLGGVARTGEMARAAVVEAGCWVLEDMTDSDESDTSETDSVASEKPSPVAQLTRVVEDFARAGSDVAQRYVAAQFHLHHASCSLEADTAQFAFEHLRTACLLWRDLVIPESIASDLRLVGKHDAMNWGGPLVYARLHATFKSVDEEKIYWRERVEQHPGVRCLEAELARSLWTAGDTNALSQLMLRVGGDLAAVIADQKRSDQSIAVNKRLEDESWAESSLVFFLTCCGSTEKKSWLSSLLSTKSAPPRRELLQLFLETESIDDEWMPHVCYALGMLWLQDKDYVRAKHCHYLAQVAESRRAQLGLFRVIEESELVDKKMLNRAFSEELLMLTKSEQVQALVKGDGLRCGACGVARIPVSAFVSHKLSECQAENAIDGGARFTACWLDDPRRRLEVFGPNV